MITISITDDFSEAPGGRYISQGNFSAELFLNTVLIPKCELALKDDVILSIDLDRGYGFASCFLEETFGGLVRFFESRYSLDITKKIISKISFISNDDPCLVNEIQKYIHEELNYYVKEEKYEYLQMEKS